MNLINWILVLTAVFINAAAQLLLKVGARALNEFAFNVGNIVPILLKLASNGFILGGLACYVVSVLVWIVLLSRVEVSLAYPLVSLGYIVTALAAWWLFGEHLSTERVTGVAVILFGVFLITRH